MPEHKDTIQAALRQSWGPDTAYSQSLWTPENAARGQCAPSSLVVQRLLGGSIIYRATYLDGMRERHYLNILPDGSEFDSTREQYPDEQSFADLPNRLKGHESLAEKLMASRANKMRFTILNDRVLALLADFTL